MRAINQILLADSVAEDPKPIEYQTENGFSRVTSELVCPAAGRL
jgi:hypothetical protein